MLVSFGSAAQGLETDIAGIAVTGKTADRGIFSDLSEIAGNTGALEATPVITQA